MSDLWNHQRDAVQFAEDRIASMLAMEVGCGKTLVALSLADLWGAERILVACPLSVVGVWEREVARHYPGRWRVARLDRGGVRRKAEDAARVSAPCIIAVNHESVWREPFRSYVAGARWDLFIADEGHRMKSPGGKLSLWAASMRTRFPRRLALSGTPMPHSPLDVYAQARFLDPSIFGQSYVQFRARYARLEVIRPGTCRRPGCGHHGKIHGEAGACLYCACHAWLGTVAQRVVGFQRLDELEAKLATLAFRVRKSDALSLPPELDVERTCRLDPATAKIYASLEADLVAEVEGGRVSAKNALSKLLRLQQLTGGVAVTEDGARRVGSAKADLLADVLEDIVEPVVVFCRFIADLDAVADVADRLGRPYGELSGRRKDLTPEATMPEDVAIMAVQIQAGGVGVDLSRASVAVYYSVGWSLGDLLQCRGRVHRHGQTRPVTHVHLVAEATVDETALDALRKREDLVEAVLARMTAAQRRTA